MKVFIIVLLMPFAVYSQTNGQSKEVTKKIIKATLEYPTLKRYKKTAEKKLYKKLPVSKETAAMVVSTAAAASKGEINTKVIKKINISVLGGTMRPDVVYNWKDGNSGATINIGWTWP